MNVSTKFAGVVFFAVAIFLARHKIIDALSSKKVPSGLATLGTCAGKRMCAIVYVAPWCPACHAIQDDLRMLGSTSANHPDFGVLVIVGGGRTPDENAATVAGYGAVATADDENTYAQALRIRKYPSFLVVSSLKVVHEDRAALQWMDESFGFSL